MGRTSIGVVHDHDVKYDAVELDDASKQPETPKCSSWARAAKFLFHELPKRCTNEAMPKRVKEVLAPKAAC
eukprot:278520-Pyramimonas_sp.AAC.1